jgi:hypothetical protein
MAEQQQPDTRPPPPGEEDLYSAETRVGPLPKDLLESLRAIRRAEEPPEIETNQDELETPAAETASEDPPPDEVMPPSDAAPISVPARSMTSEDLMLHPGVPDLEGTDAESTEPTFDKPIRFIKRGASPSIPDEQLPTGTAFGSHGVGSLLLLAVIVAGFAAAFLAWKLQ